MGQMGGVGYVWCREMGTCCEASVIKADSEIVVTDLLLCAIGISRMHRRCD